MKCRKVVQNKIMQHLFNLLWLIGMIVHLFWVPSEMMLVGMHLQSWLSVQCDGH